MRILVLIILFSLIPLSGFAANILEGPIVPECTGVFPGACDFCELFKLVQNLINFAVAFSALVATGMFVWAGILYFTASAKEQNIKDAHDIFWKVFLGFVFILGAWLIVDLVLSVLTGKGFLDSWTSVC